MSNSLALAASQLHRAALARQLYVIAGNIHPAVDHQLACRVSDVEDEYLRAGGTTTKAQGIYKTAEAEALEQLAK